MTPPFDKVPRHVALIMDGNGRWAQERGLSRIEGHKEGAQSVRAVLRAAAQAGVEFITVYAFSTENWKRPPQEIDGLMKLLVSSLEAYEQELHENRIRLRVMGQFERLPLPVRMRLQKTIDATAHYADHTFIIALSYGSRTEIANAAKQLAEKVVAGEMRIKDIDEQAVANHLYLPDIPDPELMIRTSGELRLSNFMLWQLSYCEFHITDTYWPDFREEQFFQALEAFNGRNRRYGGVNQK
ncbi:Ditrans,polycis-undecaprenyl-diphosphate synthase ((2E,6E)-farnesyl-diphosphate specific) [Pontiella desulfatans]|uniref:Isoprenyl transferase n=1 Tax=Pontiella desulfatans TaxID=2750659 RepID=A0A6C2TXJ5_PONDE|nr:polyprenyl diphosphate synthase [Pontiella desulfatans]VGO12307.1 Ditrans,polycis-undecaprenyl-diphosphate synthase ((2E,6E)-farnesyl-diphosphate specific) [Pontiella desulfatans]